MIRYLFAAALLVVASHAAHASQQLWQTALDKMTSACLVSGDIVCAAQAQAYIYEQSNGLVGKPMYGLAAMPRTRPSETRCTTTTGFGGRETYTSCRQE